MTRRTNATIAGIAYLLYIAVAFPSMVLFDRATKGEGMAAKLATLAQHSGDVHVAAVLGLLGCFCALVLAVTLYAITREEDPDIAMLGLTCRVAEGVIGAASTPATLALLALVTVSGAPGSDVTAGTQAIGALVLERVPLVAAIFFGVGSTLFSWLLLRGRMVPTWLAWLGVYGSALVAVALFLQVGGVLSDTIIQLSWIPVAIFELTLAGWFIVKGVAVRES
ncbi:MAG: hypothetical protein DMD40_15145 [Gemmatimonadetes bacterium]|nr:MAG: hypothetical protein DMD40_15145 [Gemmatimonadota bacterium]